MAGSWWLGLVAATLSCPRKLVWMASLRRRRGFSEMWSAAGTVGSLPSLKGVGPHLRRLEDDAMKVLGGLNTDGKTFLGPRHGEAKSTQRGDGLGGGGWGLGAVNDK